MRTFGRDEPDAHAVAMCFDDRDNEDHSTRPNGYGWSSRPGEAPSPAAIGRSVLDDGLDDYEMRIKGRISDSLLASFDGFDAEYEPAETVLRGSQLDQSALHGVLERVRLLGLELVEIQQVRGGKAT